MKLSFLVQVDTDDMEYHATFDAQEFANALMDVAVDMANMRRERDMTKRWWCVSANGRFLGRCYATESEIRGAAGPWCEIVGNHINIYAPPKP